MCRIGELRKIVTEIHSVFPQGLRETCRQNALASIKGETFSRVTEGEGNISSNNLLEQFQYYSKINKQEEKKVINKLIKKLGITIQDISGTEIPDKKKIQILKGLYVSQNAKLELPQAIKLKRFKKNTLGTFTQRKPNEILIDNSYPLFIDSVTIHETLHKNDFKNNWIRNTFLPCLILDKIMLILNSKTICNTLGRNALKNRAEFVAYTGEKLLHEKKKWDDLPPKIKRIYKFFNGPKIKLNSEYPEARVNKT
ncbi:MAG: hypothetical protein WCY19_07850 [Candidatus Gastranaerophilaceae bacterium]